MTKSEQPPASPDAPHTKQSLCFVLAPIGDEGSPTRERSDMLFKYVIEPVCHPLNLKPERADHIHQSGMITTQIIQRIIDAPLVIADLTEYNANVFYELAIRHSTRKPFVQIMCKGGRIPFDVAGLRTIEINHQDIPSVERAKDQLRQQISEFGDLTTHIDTPISIAVDLAALKGSQNPLQKGLADVLVQLSDIRGDVQGLTNSSNDSVLAARTAAQEVRALVATMFARISGVADPALLASVMDAASILEKARAKIKTKEGKELVTQAEEILRILALRLMQVEGVDVPGNRARRSKQPYDRLQRMTIKRSR